MDKIELYTFQWSRGQLKSVTEKLKLFSLPNI